MTKKGYSKVPGQDTTDQHEIYHPLTTANVFSMFTFWWLNDVFRKGNERPLQQSDFLPLHEQDRTRDLTERLQNQWNSDMERCNKEGTKPKLWQTVIKIISFKEMCITSSLVLLESVGRVTQPLLIGIIVHYLRFGNENSSHLYLCAGLMALNSLFYIFIHFNDFNLELLGMKLRSALQGIIYLKITLISQHTLQEATTGHVIDLISNDLQRIEDVPLSLIYCMALLVETPLIVCLMAYLIGWQSLMGVLFLLAATPYILTVASFCAKIRRQIAELSDRRISLMDELVTGIRLIKAHAWEDIYREKVKELRRKELRKVLKKSAVLAAIEPACFVVPIAASFISAITIILTGNSLTPEKGFMLLAFMSLLRRNVTARFTIYAPLLFESSASFARIQTFLLLRNLPIIGYQDRGNLSPRSSTKGNGYHSLLYKAETFPLVTRSEKNSTHTDEHKIHPLESAVEQPEHAQHQKGLSVCHATCSVEGCSLRHLLCDVSFNAAAKSLTIITGKVGSGKSTLLSSIAGEVALSSGTVVYSGRVAYVSQQAWVFSGTIRDNILFGKSYDAIKFAQVVEVCALQEDIRRFPRGDLTFVGEHGVVLSGGQRARVSLARAVYADADVYLLDDPLSAVDVKVGEHIFSQCICQQLCEKIRILVTHDKAHMKEADQLIVLDKGSVVQKGSYFDLERDNALSNILDMGLQTDSKRMTLENEEQDHKSDEAAFLQPCDGRLSEHLDISEEDRVTGTISFRLYWTYFRAGMHQIGIFGLITLFLVTQAVMTSPDVFLSYLTKMSTSYQRHSTILGAYAGLVCGAVALGLISAFVFLYISLRSSKYLHDRMVSGVLHAPVLFFDTNPTGRILNRFSEDLGCLDEVLPPKFLFSIQCLLILFFAVLVPTVANFWLILIAVPFLLSFGHLTRYYLKTSRQLKRLESICRSPVFSHFSETMTGLDTIRTQQMENDFIDQFYRHKDLHNQVFSMIKASGRWFAMRAELLCSIFISLVATVCVYISQDAALAGLTLVYGSETVFISQYAMRMISEVENLMTSVERVMTYTKLDPEPGYDIKTLPRDDWPRDGSVSFKNVSLRYYLGGPEVLKNLSFDIEGKSKVGIVGRTGDGKSSIVSALLRMPEVDGDVIIDGVNIKSVSLRESRRCLSVLGQTPVLFSGSIRNNLDPLAKHKDAELWSALETVQLKPLILNLEGQLDYELVERGGNLSVGEQQLICLARTLLQQSMIVILDEPTAKVDPNTEQTIWNIVREKLKNCTVITVAHRLNTIRNCDVIMVMREGEIAEEGTFDALMGREGGVFYNMAATEQKV